MARFHHLGRQLCAISAATRNLVEKALVERECYVLDIANVLLHSRDADCLAFPNARLSLISSPLNKKCVFVDKITVTRDKISEIEIQFPDGNVDVVGIDAEARLRALRSLLQSFSVCRLQWDRLEKDHHNQVQPPYLQQAK